jgi:hypothetical protein
MAFSISLAVVCYIFAFVFTAGYILNVQYPLLIIFLAGSVPAFVDTFWRGKSISAAVSVLIILAMGMTVPAMFSLTKRRSPMRITVVKHTPQGDTDLKVIWRDSEPDEFEKGQLKMLGLHGEAEVSNVFNLGPTQANISHTLIVLTQPLAHEVHLAEARDNVVYIQQGSAWRKFPPDASVSWRKIELYQAGRNCTVVLVWYGLGHQAGSGGPCWTQTDSNADTPRGEP